jgi:hypothetical protein
MLRRSARVARWSLFVIGAVLLVWTPLSYWVFACVRCPVPGLSEVDLWCASGVVKVMLMEQSARPAEFNFSCEFISELRQSFPPSIATTMMLDPKPFEWDRVRSVSGLFATTTIALPLWLVAGLALVWPIVSFRRHRVRHRQRGFPVQLPQEPVDQNELR